ncbi:helical backbone metal receptor [Belliella baltica]|uniref:helical backbone metal receptor n=1 Tax=Belliella baltica TaxID=232259 RepID=UPI0002FB5522
MPIYTDQLKRKVTIAESPKRIISLVPSQTELLVDLGLGDRIVGVTKFCVHPEGFKEKKQIIGGTKNFHFDKIDQLEPDLIIGNKEENYQEGIEKLAEKYPVWMSDIFDLSDAMEILGLEKSQEGLKQHSNWLI